MTDHPTPEVLVTGTATSVRADYVHGMLNAGPADGAVTRRTKMDSALT